MSDVSGGVVPQASSGPGDALSLPWKWWAGVSLITAGIGGRFFGEPVDRVALW